MVSTAKVQGNQSPQKNLPGQRTPGDPVEDNEDTEEIVQGLSQVQIQALAQKIYDLLLDELRIEGERYGRGGLR